MRFTKLVITTVALSLANAAVAQDVPQAAEPATEGQPAEPVAAVMETGPVAPQIAEAPVRQKRSFAEKAAIAAGTIGAAVGAFAALKALIKPKPAQPADVPAAQPQ